MYEATLLESTIGKYIIFKTELSNGKMNLTSKHITRREKLQKFLAWTQTTLRGVNNKRFRC